MQITKLDSRICRIEQARGIGGRRDHLAVLETLPGETAADALARLGLGNVATVGLVVPDDLDEATWEALAREHFAKRNGGDDA